MDHSNRLWLATLCADESLEAITVTAQRYRNTSLPSEPSGTVSRNHCIKVMTNRTIARHA
jgi:hypothetical protein